jgi:GTP1/Obg family GTP-binding protein
MAPPVKSFAYSSVSAQILETCNQLRSLGVASDIQLPTLVIAGNQSSGKSSVVEAIAAVSLPRASGTCTRCPTEVRLR